MSLINVDITNYSDAVLKAEKPILVAFVESSSDYYAHIMSVLKSAEESAEGKMNLAVIDCDTSPELAMLSGVITCPTVVLFDSGTERARLCGLVSATDIINLI